MPRFQRRPFSVEAVQWTGPDCSLPMVKEHCIPDDQTVGGCGHLFSVRGANGRDVYLSRGDWIIPEPDGRGHYVCRDEAFALLYEPAY